MAWRAGSKRESERRRQQDAKSQDCNCDWIVGRNSKHLGHLWPRHPPPEQLCSEQELGKMRRSGYFNPLAFDSVAQTNWSGSEVIRRRCALCAIGQDAGVLECITAPVALVADIYRLAASSQRCVIAAEGPGFLRRVPQSLLAYGSAGRF